MSVRALAAALVLGLGLAGVAVGSAQAADDAPVVKVAIAVPIVVPASADEFLDAPALAQYTADGGLLTRQLDAVLGRPVAIGIDPRIIASIRLLGTSAPASALTWLQRLEAATNQTFALGYADADVTLQTQGGSAEVLQAETFDFAIDPFLFAPAPGTSTPEPTVAPADPDLPPLPTSDAISAWAYSLTGIAWPRDDTVVAADLPKITASGYTTTVLSSGNISRDATSGPASQVDGAGVVVSDAAVSDSLRAASEATTDADWTAALADLSSAISAGARVQAGSPTLLATLDRTMSVGRLADTLDLLSADPAVELVPFSQALGTTPTDGTIVDLPQAADRVSRAGQMIQGENAERSFATVASDPALITSNRRLELLTLLSSEWEANLDGWPEAADAFTTDSIALRNSVHLVESNNFLLIADNGQYLPVTVSNGLDQPVTVYIDVRSRSSLLAIDKSVLKLEIKPGTQGKVDVPVHSLSNGVVQVDVSLASSAGVAIGSPISSEVNVQAGWETPIVVAIAVLVVVVFGVGVVRTVLRRRKGGADD
ncbi:MAG: hypothetical protein JWR04_2927 [Rhodoglobus sp.]|nr:hypothetical protein [Rhodoglobus sp.]